MPSRLTRRRFLARTAAAATGVAAVRFPAPLVLRAAQQEWGDLVGRFLYDGPAPPRRKLKVDKDVECCGKFDIRDESLMVGPDGGLANVFVYLRTRRVPVCPELEHSLPSRVVLDNRNCIFIPHCMGIWLTRQEFYTVNSDPVAQNVECNPVGDLGLNVVLPAADPQAPPGQKVDATWRFRVTQSLPTLIRCNYHPWESAYIIIRDTPYFAISGADGTFRIRSLPAGRLEFQFWQERVGPLEAPGWPRGRRELEMKPGTNDLGTFKFPPAWFRQDGGAAL